MLQPRFDPWQETPSWHPRCWYGHKMRRWTWSEMSLGGYHDGEWEYATREQCAHKFLEDTYGR